MRPYASERETDPAFPVVAAMEDDGIRNEPNAEPIAVGALTAARTLRRSTSTECSVRCNC